MIFPVPDVVDRDCPCSIWDNSATPVNIDASEGRPIELGVKFRTDSDGYITGLRFYKGSANTGTHIGHLWNAGGDLIASVVFSGETASGWQQVNFGSGITVTANTTYVASYYSPSGNYSYTNPYFSTATYNAPVKALADGEDGANGVYRYDSPGFPDQVFVGGSPNYWVDIIFHTVVISDTSPPVATILTPVNGAININGYANISATFNESLDPASVSASSFVLRNPSNALVPANVTYSALENKAILNPTAKLADFTIYTAEIISGTNGIKDLAGNPLAANVAWSFTTSPAAPPAPTDGPGGPILVISASANPFSRYYTEILRAEGLNAFFTGTSLP